MVVERESSVSRSNLDCLLRCVTPVVPSQSLPKTEIRNLNRLWHPWEREKIEFFTLRDLWQRYDQWSAYGAGVPIVLSRGETLVQYYVPYLSAIQIFTSGSFVNSFREESESGDFEGGILSATRAATSARSCLGRTGARPPRREDDSPWQLSDRLGYRYFQYFERSTPLCASPANGQDQ
ncbi:hypothetical protein MLD38_009165 [Melastoma candidum]|uniref:Uncharacterized protein n=1 Tax=Melastoma candidum TaxID=119954 RepID=A0ACB9S100_9MYRT|nr:hypothetical protein MLD38_009165 [Melastoma candidum]